jgi:hypothetical protein
MAMSMLEAGGLEIVTDGVRVADEHNPLGYYEYERVKTLGVDTDVSWLEIARGKAVKVISFLLPHLPATYNYRVVFMHRDMDEVLTSQYRMLGETQVRDPAADRRMAKAYEEHLGAVGDLLRRRLCFEVLDLRYEQMLDRPTEQAERLAGFVGVPLDVPAMASVVNRGLYRNRRR